MANTFSQIHIQVVFAVKHRQNLLLPQWRPALFEYMAGVIRNHGHKSLIVNGVTDHVHAFIGLKPSVALSDLVRDIKSASTAYINERKLVKGHFTWQEGYGAFSYAHSQVPEVYRYVLNQERHPQKRNFKEEYLELLQKFEIPFEEKYLFEWLD